MATDRMKSVSNLMKRVISEIIRELKDPRVDSFVSVTAVEVTRDLRSARVFISYIGEDEKSEAAAEGLNNAKGYVRKRLMEEITIKRIPDLSFRPDGSIAKGVRVCRLIDELREQDKDKAGEDA